MQWAQLCKRWTVTFVFLCACLGYGQVPVGADASSAPSLVISQLKITSSSGQFVTLYNASDSALDMSKYQLAYFNHYDLSKATSSRLISLNGVVPAHGYYMVNDSSLLLCYQLTIDSVSLGFSSTAGTLQVLARDQGSDSSSSPTIEDYVAWSKTTATGAQALPADTSAWLHRQPVDETNHPAIASPGAGEWQAIQSAPDNACTYVAVGGPATPIATGQEQLLPSTEPPATILDNAGQVVSGPTLPASDIGLMTPEITELLPNPAGSGTDSSDEFIELYNPNGVAFDLSGFSLQSGTSSSRSFSFPVGTTLPAKSFTIFKQNITKLTLSNTGGQVKLLDPRGNSISSTAAYSNAPDGAAWARANGNWRWTITPTPGSANVIRELPAKKQAAKSSSAAKTKKSAATKAKKTKKRAVATVPSARQTDKGSISPIHVRTLALIGGLALLYGAYEYRADLAAKYRQCRSYFRRRKPFGKPAEGWRSD